MKKYDVVIVGGGASGLCAAVCIKKQCPQASVAVLEALDRVGKKLITTGNGRCNITNKEITASHYHGEDRDFGMFALEKYAGNPTQDFFSDIGVLTVYEQNGKAFPYSYQASSVVDALRFATSKLGVETLTGVSVTDFSKTDGGYTVITETDKFFGNFLVIAAGLLSGGEKVGSTGKILRLLESKGFKTARMTPAIVQLKTETDIVKTLKGIKFNGNASLVINGKTVQTEYGEILFTEYGLSGPPILSLSRETVRNAGEKFISLDVFADFNLSNLITMLKARRKQLSGRTLETFFTGLLNRLLGFAVLKKCAFDLNKKCETLTDDDILKIAKTLKNFEFKVVGDKGFLNSQVTAGGLLTSAFDRKTMEASMFKNLFAVGEILDIDGDCGGYNLQWAWSSALAAADCISRRVNNASLK